MCVPVAIIGLAISAASAVASHAAQNSAAKSSARGLRQAEDQQQMDLIRQADEQQEAAGQQMNEHARSAMRDAALFDTVAGEYGGGNTVDRAASVGGVQQGEQLATIGRSAELASQNNRNASLATTQRTNASLASVRMPSSVGLALQIGGQIGGAYVKEKAPEWQGKENERKVMERWRAAQTQSRKAAIETMPYLKSNRSLGD